MIVPITLPIIDAPTETRAMFVDPLPESWLDFRDGRREYQMHPLHVLQQDGDYLDNL